MGHTENLYVFASDGNHTGVGEHSPATGFDWGAEKGQRQLEAFVADLGDDVSPHDVWAAMREREIDPPAMCALDTALWDLLAKQAGLPLYRLLGLPKRSHATSVTIGIETPEIIRERVPDILRRTGGKHLKIKLGSPQGYEHDQANFEAARESAAPFGVSLRIDANGGWDVPTARMMMGWLAERGVEYVEQPLAEGREEDLPAIFEGRPLPIYADESCRFARDVPKLAGKVDGINLKLIKCGGITEAVRIVAAARAHGLGTMIGCMSEASVAIAAGAAIAALFDHVDLDSHLNLNPDPTEGLLLHNGVVLPRDVPGHGAGVRAEVLREHGLP